MATTKKTATKKTAVKKTTKKTTRKKNSTAQAGSVVEIHYKGTLTDGTQFDSSYDRGSPITTTVGQGNLIAGFENALIGMKKGQTKSITLAPEEAYGPSNPDAFNTVQRNQFPADYVFVEGQPVQGTTEGGQPIFATIASFTDTDVTLDMNHPLAGKELNFDIELVNVETPTEQSSTAATTE